MKTPALMVFLVLVVCALVTMVDQAEARTRFDVGQAMLDLLWFIRR